MVNIRHPPCNTCCDWEKLERLFEYGRAGAGTCCTYGNDELDAERRPINEYSTIVHGVLDCSVYRGVYGYLYWTCASLPAAVQSHPIRPTTSPIMQLTDVMTRSHFAKWSLLRPRRSPANSDLVGWEITILLCGLLSDICAGSVPFRSIKSGIRQV